ncbi:hypothetical protein AMTR_s00093p00160790 [Amborella trichopoda]|uniref:Aminotransferase-like plant mobile domain-containing protein n=1 Tax=Amborella trichopoda TaxID=13333 RepID=W1NU82_AMBTC|nr:hypothetical protein AMTR_s00093p00160790 [Amborella trichopoda]
MGKVVDSWAEAGSCPDWLCLRYRPDTCSIPLRCGEHAPTLEDVTRILGVRSEGKPILSIPLRMFRSYASNYKELLDIRLENTRGRHDSKIHLRKLRWDFTGVAHRVERMIGGGAPRVSIFVGRRPSHRGKGPMEVDGAGERERIRDAHERAMIEDELEVFRQEVDLTIDHGPLSDSEIYFGELLFLDRSKGRAHLLVVCVIKQLDYLERVAWRPSIVG